MLVTYIAEHDTGARVVIPRPLGDWHGTYYVTKAQRGTPISGPELLAAMDAAPISRETCDAALDGMAANETPAEHSDACVCVYCTPTPRDEDKTKGDDAT